MAEISHVQAEILGYLNRIPAVPDEFPVEPTLLFGLSERAYREAFSALVGAMRKAYQDLYDDPARFGLPMEPIEAHWNGDLRHLHVQTINKLGDIAVALGANGVLSGDELRVDALGYRASVKSIKLKTAFLEELRSVGFCIEEPTRGQETFVVRYPAHPDVVIALKSYAAAPPLTADYRESNYFDYLSVADRERLGEDAIVKDYVALIGGEYGALIEAVDSLFTKDLGLTSLVKTTSIEYYHRKKRVARLCLNYERKTSRVILKLKSMDRYIELIEALPQHLRAHFERDGCGYCGFQGATKDFCKFRLHWTLDGIKHVTCNFPTFEFFEASAADAPALAGLMRAEYKLG